MPRMDDIDWSDDIQVVDLIAGFIRSGRDTDLGEGEQIAMFGEQNGGRTMDDMNRLWKRAEKLVKAEEGT